MSLVTSASRNENIPEHQKYSKILKKVPFSNSKSRTPRFESHPQKTKGSTGKIIQRERNEAAIVKLNTALYGLERY